MVPPSPPWVSPECRGRSKPGTLPSVAQKNEGEKQNFWLTSECPTLISLSLTKLHYNLNCARLKPRLWSQDWMDVSFLSSHRWNPLHIGIILRGLFKNCWSTNQNCFLFREYIISLVFLQLFCCCCWCGWREGRGWTIFLLVVCFCFFFSEKVTCLYLNNY